MSYIGCSMNGMIINHLMYADDPCIVAPSPTALQEVLDICADFPVSNSIIFNEKKCMCFKPNISCFKTFSSSIKVKLFRSFLCNAYGCHLWSTYKQYTYKCVVVVFNNIYRKLFGILSGDSIHAFYVNNNIDSFGLLVRKNVYSFKTRSGASTMYCF